MRRAGALGLVGLAVALVAIGGNLTFGAFSSQTANPSNTVSADLVYPGGRSTTAWGVTDAAGSTPVDASDPLAFDDDRYTLTKSWPSAYGAGNYLELRLAGPLPAALANQGASFLFDFADDRNPANDEVCFYFEVRRASTGALLSTHGSPSAPIACEAKRTVLRTSTPLPAIANTDVGNDLAIRVYAAHSGGGQMRLHRATVELTAANNNTWTLDEIRFDDRADGSPASTTWPLALADGIELATADWATAFAADRYLEVRFPTRHVPAGASVSSASLTHRYRSQAGQTFCYWLEVYSGSSLIASRGSTATPFACTSSGSLVTDTINLPEIAGAGNAASLSARIRGRSSPAGRSQHDQIQLTVNYSLPAGS